MIQIAESACDLQSLRERHIRRRVSPGKTAVTLFIKLYHFCDRIRFACDSHIDISVPHKFLPAENPHAVNLHKTRWIDDLHYNVSAAFCSVLRCADNDAVCIRRIRSAHTDAAALVCSLIDVGRSTHIIFLLHIAALRQLQVTLRTGKRIAFFRYRNLLKSCNHLVKPPFFLV